MSTLRAPTRAFAVCCLAWATAPVGCTITRPANPAPSPSAATAAPAAVGDATPEGPEAQLAQWARSISLHQRPDVAAELAAAERAVLARHATRLRVDTTVTAEAVRNWYDTHPDAFERRILRARHIVTRPAPGRDEYDRRVNRESAYARALRAYARLRIGEAFDAVARALSDDPMTAPKGGELGVIREGAVDPDFFAIAAELPADGYSKPLETVVGFHIIQRIGPVTIERESLESATPRIRATLRHTARERLLAEARAASPAGPHGGD